MFGAVAAIAAAGMFSASTTTASEKKATGDHPKAEKKTIKCMGGNACKGKSECGVPGAHTCHTRNACKGKGWVMVASEKECEDLKAKNAEPAAQKKS
jgi:uncharacterized membrane protein